MLAGLIQAQLEVQELLVQQELPAYLGQQALPEQLVLQGQQDQLVQLVLPELQALLEVVQQLVPGRRCLQFRVPDQNRLAQAYFK